MKKKILCIVLAAALLLGILIPGTALAAKGDKPSPPGAIKDFLAEMTATWIEDTNYYVNVFPLYDDGTIIPSGVFFVNPGLAMQWQVVDRQMTGEMTGSFEGTVTVIYSGLLDDFQAGPITGTIEIVTKPGKKHSIIYGTFEGFTAMDNYAPPLVEVIFLGDMVLSGGTGIYKHISGQGSFGTAEPIQLTVDVAGHVIDIEGSMSMSGTYTKSAKLKNIHKDKGPKGDKGH